MLDRPVSIGRLPDCDVIVASDQVSRVHAYVVPTPDGLLLVDRSRHGTLINGERMRAPWLLAEGDTVQIGSALLRVEQALAEAGEAAPIPAFRARLRIWLRRYGPSEVLGTVAAVGAATAIMDATGKTVVAAYAGTLAETVVFYGIMILRDAIREAHQAGKRGKPYGSCDSGEAGLRSGLLRAGPDDLRVAPGPSDRPGFSRPAAAHYRDDAAEGGG